MKKQRYHTNYKGQLIDNTRDWEYKPLTKKTPIQMLNNLNDEMEKADQLFKRMGFEGYDYLILEKIMETLFQSHPSQAKEFHDAKLSDNSTVIYDGKEHSIKDTVDEFNNQRVQLWEKTRKNEELLSDIGVMQQKINVLYTEIMMAKEHMGSEEWDDYLERRKEFEDTVGVQWIRGKSG